MNFAIFDFFASFKLPSADVLYKVLNVFVKQCRTFSMQRHMCKFMWDTLAMRCLVWLTAHHISHVNSCLLYRRFLGSAWIYSETMWTGAVDGMKASLLSTCLPIAGLRASIIHQTRQTNIFDSASKRPIHNLPEIKFDTSRGLVHRSI